MAFTGDQVILYAADGTQFEVSGQLGKHIVPVCLADQCQAVVHLNVNAETLELIIDFCQQQLQHPEPERNEAWNEEFCSRQSQTQLFELILAANTLRIKSLLKSTCEYMARLIRGKTPEEIRHTFNIKNDYARRGGGCS